MGQDIVRRLTSRKFLLAVGTAVSLLATGHVTQAGIVSLAYGLVQGIIDFNGGDTVTAAPAPAVAPTATSTVQYVSVPIPTTTAPVFTNVPDVGPPTTAI